MDMDITPPIQYGEMSWPDNSDNWSAERHKLFDFYAEWAKAVALQYFARYRVDGAETDDYIHYASIGLLEAIDRFDPAAGRYFKPYAKFRIKGAILANIVGYSEKAQCLSWKYDKIQQRLALGGDKAEQQEPHRLLVDSVLQLALGFLLEEQSGADTESEQLLDSMFYNSVEMEHQKDKLHQAVGNLEYPYQFIITYHYMYGVSFTDIAEILILTKGRISQLHKEAMLILRKKMSW